MEKDYRNNNSAETIETSIDLTKILKILIRNKRLISYFIFGSFIASALYSLTLKKIWQGDLQIVLEDRKEEESLLQGLSSISNSSSFSKLNANSSLKTEVGILESPSVLMSVFEFIKEKKGSKKSLDKLTFANWKKNSLNIKLKRSTSILNLSYKDSDKGIIIPVLNKISTEYQNYSGKKRSRDLELGEEYFQKQISKYKLKSKESLKEAQEYALNQDLAILFGNSEIDKEIPNSLEIEQIRIRSANELRSINYRLKQLSTIGLDYKRLMILGKSIPEILSEPYAEELFNIESAILIAKSKYQSNDEKITKLEDRKLLLLEILKSQIKSYLEARKINSEAKLKSSERPKGVIIKYGELLSNAIRDKNTLQNLENNFRFVQLEKARRKDPWKLIAEPTLLPEPVKPNKIEIIGIGTLLGFITGSIFSLYQNNKKKIIFETSDINQYLINYPTIQEIDIKDPKNITETFNFISKKYLYKIEDEFAILFLGEEENKDEYKKIIKSTQLFKDKNLTNNLDQINEDFKIIMLIPLGITNGYELKEKLKRIYLKNQEIIAILSITNLRKDKKS